MLNNKTSDKVFFQQFSLGVRLVLTGRKGPFVTFIVPFQLKSQNEMMAFSQPLNGIWETLHDILYCENCHALPVGMVNWN